MTGEIPLPEQMKRTKHTHGQTHTHIPKQDKTENTPHVLCQCVFLFIHEFTDTYSAPPKLFFFLFKWWILNFIPVDRSTVSLENKLFLGRTGERWCWYVRGHLEVFVISHSRTTRRARLLFTVVLLYSLQERLLVAVFRLSVTTGNICKRRKPMQLPEQAHVWRRTKWEHPSLMAYVDLESCICVWWRWWERPFFFMDWFAQIRLYP